MLNQLTHRHYEKPNGDEDGVVRTMMCGPWL